MNCKKFSLSDRLKSFKYAFNGFKILLKHEHNVRIHLFFVFFVCFLSFFFCISLLEWMIVLILIALVIGMEILNSCIERICDFISPTVDNRIKAIKDISSAAVLLTVIISIVCGLIIFLPKIYHMFLNLSFF